MHTLTFANALTFGAAILTAQRLLLTLSVFSPGSA